MGDHPLIAHFPPTNRNINAQKLQRWAYSSRSRRGHDSSTTRTAAAKTTATIPPTIEVEIAQLVKASCAVIPSSYPPAKSVHAVSVRSSSARRAQKTPEFRFLTETFLMYRCLMR